MIVVLQCRLLISCYEKKLPCVFNPLQPRFLLPAAKCPPHWYSSQQGSWKKRLFLVTNPCILLFPQLGPYGPQGNPVPRTCPQIDQVCEAYIISFWQVGLLDNCQKFPSAIEHLTSNLMLPQLLPLETPQVSDLRCTLISTWLATIDLLPLQTESGIHSLDTS